MEAMGYQALLPALYSSGQFEWLCSDEDVALCDATHRRTESCCHAQQRRLDLMFTLAYVGLNVASLPLSALMHRFPPRYITSTALFLKVFAYILLALSTDGASPWLGSSHYQDLALVAYMMVASLGICACFPFLSLPAHLFPVAYMGLACSSLMGSADASSIGYYVVRVLYLQAGVKLRTMFLCYAGISLIASVASWRLLYPLRSAKEEAALAKERNKTEDDDEETQGVLARMCSVKFFSLLQWFCAFFICKYFYMTNITSEAKWLTDNDDRALDMNTAFSIIMPATGVLTPLVGWLLGKGFKVSLLVNCGLAVMLMVCSCVKVYAVNYGMLVAVAASRFMVFSIMPTLCSHPDVWGPEGGVFFSAMSGIAGALSMANFGFTALSHHSFLPMNLALGAMCVAATAWLVSYLNGVHIK